MLSISGMLKFGYAQSLEVLIGKYLDTETATRFFDAVPWKIALSMICIVLQMLSPGAGDN